MKFESCINRRLLWWTQLLMTQVIFHVISSYWTSTFVLFAMSSLIKSLMCSKCIISHSQNHVMHFFSFSFLGVYFQYHSGIIYITAYYTIPDTLQTLFTMPYSSEIQILYLAAGNKLGKHFMNCLCCNNGIQENFRCLGSLYNQLLKILVRETSIELVEFFIAMKNSCIKRFDRKWKVLSDYLL